MLTSQHETCPLQSVVVLTLCAPIIIRTARIVDSAAITPSRMFVTVIAEKDEIKVLSFCNSKSKAVFPKIVCSLTPFGFAK
jgi:hypothetical protein